MRVRPGRGILFVVIAVIGLTASADAVSAQFAGTSAHHRYRLLVFLAQPIAKGSDYLEIQVTTDNNRECASSTYFFPITVLRGHEFAVKADFATQDLTTANGKNFSQTPGGADFAASGRVHGLTPTGEATRVSGVITGPRVCGGTDSYTLSG
jgi:hypothetical protein